MVKFFEEDTNDELDPHSLNDDDFLFGDDHETVDDHLLTDDYDDDELERRRLAYADLKRNDKIFNNTYNIGLDSSEDDEPSQRAGNSEIRLDQSSPDYHMYDPQRFSESLDTSIIQRDIYNFIQCDSRVATILGNEPDKKKFTKSEINEIFEILNSGLTGGAVSNMFITSIHVLDAISSMVNMEYKKIFDQLTYENKEILLLELNSKYGFLDNTGKNYKIF